MKQLAAALVATLFASAVGAADIYQGFAKGNPDLRPQANPVAGTTAIQPSVGDSVDRYQGWADGNGDLFKRFDASVTDHQPPKIYTGLSGNPDL